MKDIFGVTITDKDGSYFKSMDDESLVIAQKEVVAKENKS